MKVRSKSRKNRNKYIYEHIQLVLSQNKKAISDLYDSTLISLDRRPVLSI